MTASTVAVESDRDDAEAVSGPSSNATEDATAERRARDAPLDGRLLVVLVTAAAAVAASTAIRIAYNAPFAPVEVPTRAIPAANAVALLGVGAALGTLALASRRSGVRVGLLFAAVFGALATASDAAAVAAAVAVPAGAAVALAHALWRPTTYVELRRRVVAAAFPAAIGLSLVGTAWGLGAGVREAGSVAFLLAATLLAALAETDRLALLAGAGGFLCVAAASAAAPYVTGSALLAGFGVVGSPHLLAATAAFGGVAALVAGLRDGDRSLALGAGVLLVAGVPAAPTAALAASLGAVLVAVDPADLLATAEVSSR
ncbi:phosphate ABC transporter permease [Halorubrum depositum]|uniref:phosphate ABC transporter permease n=1 Tax=Halorubrum depositum TaxID=2583992 RepID=UPI00119E6706|nr:phosphate ABC transporter permease [Halorubrum depositum]